ncbi:hypothetical protein AB0M05_19100 [Streptomyces violaceusniger]
MPEQSTPVPGLAPVRAPAAVTCVDWWGWIDGVRFEKAETNCG